MATPNKGAESTRNATTPTEAKTPPSGQGPRVIAGARERVNKVVNPEIAPPVPPQRRAERRPEMIKQRREERMKSYERQRRIRQWSRIGGALVAVLLVAGLVWTAWSYAEDRQARGAIEDDVQTYQVEQGHFDGPQTYAQTPPVGGIHQDVWQNCGFYDAPVANENAVHSLEHGAVWITYRPDLPADQVAKLHDLVDEFGSHVLVSPYPGLPAPVVASAWSKQMTLESATDERLETFIRVYRQGPQTPEPGARCTGGIGTPA